MNKYKTYENSSIYALIDPRDDKVRYVGYTSKKIEDRLRAHISEATSVYSFSTKTDKSLWIKELLNLDLKPIVKLLEYVSFKDRKEKERYWIKYYGGQTVLLNKTDGGDIEYIPSYVSNKNTYFKRVYLSKKYKKSYIHSVWFYFICNFKIHLDKCPDYKFTLQEMDSENETLPMTFSEHCDRIKKSKNMYDKMGCQEIKDRYELTMEYGNDDEYEDIDVPGSIAHTVFRLKREKRKARRKQKEFENVA